MFPAEEMKTCQQVRALEQGARGCQWSMQGTARTTAAPQGSQQAQDGLLCAPGKGTFMPCTHREANEEPASCSTSETGMRTPKPQLISLLFAYV